MIQIVENGLVISLQFTILLVTTVGWGYWLNRCLPRTVRQNRIIQIMCFIGGWILPLLVSQNLLYIDIRIQWSAWPVLLVGLSGTVFLVRSSLGNRISPRTAPTLVPLAVVFICVTIFHMLPLIAKGPGNYYGYGHHDQQNYVQLAQFLIERPFSTTLHEAGLHPWLVKAIDTKDFRIGECVANAYLATIAATDAKNAYGSLTVFLVGLLSVASWAFLRRAGARMSVATIGAVWIGILPAVTKISLDGFLSQTSVFFIFPSLGILILDPNTIPPRSRIILSSLLLSYLFSSYTELYIIGIAICFSGTILNAKPPFMRRLAYFSFGMTLSLILIPAYLPRAISFIYRQYQTAVDPMTLASLFPTAGTLQGWTILFFNHGSGGLAHLWAFVAAALLLSLPLGLSSVNVRRRIGLISTVGAPVFLILYYSSATTPSLYIIGKLSAMFAPFFASLVILTIERSGNFLPRVIARYFPLFFAKQRRSTAGFSRYFTIGASLVLCAGSAYASLSLFKPIFRSEGILSAIDSAEARATYKFLESHPNDIFWLKEEHVILNAWFAYHARHAKMYVGVPKVGDRSMPVDDFAFRQKPPDLRNIYLVNASGVARVKDLVNSPNIVVHNPQGIDEVNSHRFYWLGDGLDMELYHFGNTAHSFRLVFSASAGPANPDPERSLALLGPSGAVGNAHFSGTTRLSFDLLLQPGPNRFRLAVTKPTDWTVHIPGDPRKHMVSISNIALQPVRP